MAANSGGSTADLAFKVEAWTIGRAAAASYRSGLAAGVAVVAEVAAIASEASFAASSSSTVLGSEGAGARQAAREAASRVPFGWRTWVAR